MVVKTVHVTWKLNRADKHVHVLGNQQQWRKQTGRVNTTMNNLNNAQLVGNLSSFIIGWQADVSLLLSIRSGKISGLNLPKKIQKEILPDQSIDFLCLDIVQGLHSLLNLTFVGGDINDENQCVVLLNFLHCRLSGQRKFDDVVCLGTFSTFARLHQNLWVSIQLESFGAEKMHFGVHSGGLASISLLQSSCDFLCFICTKYTPLKKKWL